jgi:hypothetical protein
VYEVSLVVWLLPVPGSAVYKPTYRFVYGDEAALSAMFAQAVALKISFSRLLQVVIDFAIGYL